MVIRASVFSMAWPPFLLLVLLPLFSLSFSGVPPPPHCKGPVCLQEGDRGIVLVLAVRQTMYLPVCDDSWDRVDADVACRQAGYSRGALRATTTGRAQGRQFVMDEVSHRER